MMVEQSKIFGLLVKPTPFSAAECEQMRAWLLAADAGDGAVDGQTGVVVWVYELLSHHLSLLPVPRALYLPDEAEPSDPVMRAAREGALDRFIAEHPRELSPAPDWRPFFFNTLRNEDVLARFWYELRHAIPGLEADPTGVKLGQTEQFARTFRLLWIMVALSVLLILGPLVVLGTRGLRVWANLPFAVYFAALGAGFILAMSGLIQRYVLFLGHQSYAFASVIGGLLVSAGIGSFIAGRYEQQPRRVMAVAVGAICAMLAVLHFGLDSLFGATASWSLPLRVTTSVVVPSVTWWLVRTKSPPPSPRFSTTCRR